MLKPDQIEEYARLAIKLAAPLIARNRMIVDGPDYEDEVNGRLGLAVPAWDADRDIPFDKYVNYNVRIACAQARRAHHILGVNAVRAATKHPGRHALPRRYTLHEGDALFADRVGRPDPTPQFEAEESFDRAVVSLPPMQRLVATLYYRDGVGWADIGRITGKSPTAIHSLHQRIKEKLGGQP